MPARMQSAYVWMVSGPSAKDAHAGGGLGMLSRGGIASSLHILGARRIDGVSECKRARGNEHAEAFTLGSIFTRPDIDRFNAQQARYRIDAPLGRGGMSTVFRGRDTVLDREVAIKVFAASAADDGELRAQQREARLLGGSSHHSVVRLFDVGVDFLPDGSPRMFLVTELVEGSDLRVRLRSGPLPLLHAAHIAYDLAEGLAYLHARGVVHRDVKPANVLLVQHTEGRRPRVKLTDFGIAMRDEQLAGLERSETTGTAAYLSPEQAAGEEITQATDVYALGLVVLETLTGRTAFPGGVVESALARLDRDPGVPDHLPREWLDVLTAMTRRSPHDRPTAAAAAEAFRQILMTEIVRSDGADPEGSVSRLAAVHRYAVLAPGGDPDLDQLCALASRLLRADGAVIAIADEDRALVRAGAGAPLPAVARSRYVDGVLEEQALTLPDVGTGVGAPLLGEGVGAYASAPLRTHDGVAIGVAAVWSRAPRPFSDDDLATVQDIADMAMHEVELRRAVRRHLVPQAPRAGAV
jgi:GAF domain-containing protein/tRNA A-37 threonylcarbamoyl transferase component Bud32